MTVHEEVHIRDAININANICRGKKDGSVVFWTRSERAPSEVTASNAEINCLNNKLSGLSTCDDCYKSIKSRIAQMEAYRDSFK